MEGDVGRNETAAAASEERRTTGTPSGDIGDPVVNVEVVAPAGDRDFDMEDPDDVEVVAEDGLLYGGVRQAVWPLWKPLPFAVLSTLALVCVATAIACLQLPISQWGGGPEARKGAAIAVLSGRQLQSLRQSSGPSAAGCDEAPERLLFLWSGKVPHTNSSVKDDLWVFDLERRVWRRQYSFPSSSNYTGDRPMPRWKAGTVRWSNESLVVFGGDAMGVSVDGEKVRHLYLDDMWTLKINVYDNKFAWKGLEPQHPAQGSSKRRVQGGTREPDRRRAMAATLIPRSQQPNLPRSDALFIHGGRTRASGLDNDAWIYNLSSPSSGWSRVWPTRKEGNGSMRGVEPSSRKGHVAVTIPGPTGPLVWIFGGRNDSRDVDPYKSDVWVFDPYRQEWEDWTPSDGPAPLARDHLGGWYFNGSVYIYGGRGGTGYYTAEVLGDMWTFDVFSRRWSQVFPHKEGRPGPRFLYAMDTYDASEPCASSRDDLLELEVPAATCTGQPEPSGSFANDSQAVPCTSASRQARDSHEEASKPDVRVVVFGGQSSDGCYLNDVYELQLTTLRWRMLSSVKGPRELRCHDSDASGCDNDDDDAGCGEGDVVASLQGVIAGGQDDIVVGGEHDNVVAAEQDVIMGGEQDGEVGGEQDVIMHMGGEQNGEVDGKMGMD